ncbi:serine protease inhibitor 28Dc isoform X1 [Dendroctonus ponderosae]|uniref:Serpin domain-containing protein n=2 Tax=Dendroctonus ponderosae TaxID=77166 RepID=U4UQY2_DENPD|nr:serine protease inhibitor 28Dc isoform X1 [Dendroctonus ponderosae]ERL95517.1 hypothetical protein D910_12779 [Dendroctonus ponderosae]
MNRRFYLLTTIGVLKLFEKLVSLRRVSTLETFPEDSLFDANMIGLFNLLSVLVLVKLSLEAGGRNVSSQIFFPSGDSFSASPDFDQLPAVQALDPNDLVAIRGSSVYETFVDDIIARSTARLTVKINNLLIAQNGHDDNVLFSPLSITSVLALVLLGSNGATFKEISNFWGLQIGIPDIDQKSQIVHEQFGRIIKKLNRTAGFEPGDEVAVASAVFIQDGYPIREIYRSTAQEVYQSSIVNVDFQANPYKAQALINNWVAERTRNKIKSILNEAPSGDTRIILASALYFKAEWEQHFFVGLTKRRPFFVDGRSVSTNLEVDLMANGGEFPYHRDTELGCEILGLPYKGRKSTMYVVMPFESSRAKLKEFESKITEADLSRLVKQTKVTGVVLLMPRMKIDATLDLKDTLRALGVRSLFDPSASNLALLSPGQPQLYSNSSNHRASVSDRFDSFQSIDNIRQLINSESSDNSYQNPGLYASQVIHKVFMDITEKGTEAAAATAVSLSRDGSRVTFRVDVPFNFFIRHDETDMILFWGSIVVPNPSYKTAQTTRGGL